MDPAELPDRVDVAILGGGLAGLVLADRLADRASVLVVEGAAPPAPASLRSLGIAARGGSDSPIRLAQALGQDRARDLWLWSDRACTNLIQLCDRLGLPPSTAGVLRLALDPAEAREIEQSISLVEDWQGQGTCRRFGSEELLSGGVGRDFLVGIRVSGDGVVDTELLHGRLRESLVSRATLIPASASLGPTQAEGNCVTVGDRQVLAELVVVAAGASSSQIHPWFEEAIHPVRLQALRSEGPGLPREPAALAGSACLARHRFEGWEWSNEGQLRFVGCRWAEGPEMGAGETDDGISSNQVTAKQEEFIARHLLSDAKPKSTTTWTGIVGFSCDGLPLVGPLPGSPRLLAMTGWSGWGLSAIAAAAEDLSCAILGQEGPEAPVELLSPRRML